MLIIEHLCKLAWKAKAILSDTTVRRSAVDQEDLPKTILKIRKKPQSSRWSYYLQVFQRLY